MDECELNELKKIFESAESITNNSIKYAYEHALNNPEEAREELKKKYSLR